MAKPTLSDFVDFLSRAVKGGSREIDMGDIKSPAIKKGRPPKIAPVNAPVNLNEIDVGDIDPLAIKKGRPAKSPIIDPNEIALDKAKGKLQIGDSPSSPVSVNELDMGDIDSINPNIDDYKLPISSAGTSPVGGGKVPSVLGQSADDIAGPLTTRSSTIPTEVGPQVIGKGTSRFAGKADDVIEAEFEAINKMPEGPLKNVAIKKFNLGRPAKIIAGAVAGTYLLNKLNEESPSVDFSPAKINGTPEEEETLISQKPSQQPPGSKDSPSLDAASSQSKLQKILDQSNVSKEETKPVQSDRLAYMEMMQNAQDTANKNQFNAALLKAAMQAGSAIAGPGVKIDTSIADALAKSADQPVSDIEKLIKTETSSRELKELERKEKDDLESRDPKSAKSIAARKQWTQYLPGITEDMSAYDVTKDLNQKIQLLVTKEAAESRKQARAEAAAEKKEAKAAKEEQYKETNKFKAQASVDKQVSQLYKSKDYEAYNAAKDAQVALDAAIASGDKTEAGTAFMQFGKIAQGDNSVLRDGDMVMLAGGYDYTSVGDMLSKLRAKAAGGNFNDKELKQMKKVAEKVQQLKGSRVQQLVSPIIQRAESNDLNLLEHFDPSVIEEFSAKPSESSELTTPINISPETREKRIKFIMDKGNTREEAIFALKKAGKI